MEKKPFSRDAQRFLDGEPHAPLSDAEREQAERLLQGVQAYRARLAPPDSSMADAVLHEVRRSRRRSAWRWIFEPRPIRLRPVWVPVMAAAAALVIWLGVRTDGTGDIPTARTAGVTDTVFVRFQLRAPDASAVAIAGSFGEWDPQAFPLVREDGGLWSITLALPLGEHQYQFVIDNERWVPDPRAHANVDDGFGGTNSVVIVGPRGVVQS